MPNVYIASDGKRYVELTNPNIEPLLSRKNKLKGPIYRIYRSPFGKLEAKIFARRNYLITPGYLNWIAQRISEGDEFCVLEKIALQSGYLQR